MPSATANYGWQKPDVGASNDQWGGLLNNDLDAIDAQVKANQTAIPAASTSTPVMDGTAAVGVGTTWARADHVHGSDTSRVAKAGDTMTGALTINGPTSGALTVNNPAMFSSAVALSTWGQINLVQGNATIGNWMQGFTGSATAAGTRWAIALGDGTAESGSNAGSNFIINNYSDTGAYLSSPFSINRATGNATFSSFVTANGGMVTISASGTNFASLQLAKSGSGQANQIVGYTGAAASATTRWNMLVGDSTTESGSNAGSNFVINRYSDAGAYINAPLSIARTSGVCTFSAAIVNGPSDRRLKENIAPLEGSLDKVLALQGVSFNFIATPNKPEIGLIAQDVEPVVPEVVQVYEHVTDPTVTPMAVEPMMALDYPKLTALLIEAVKTLAARVEALEAAGA